MKRARELFIGSHETLVLTHLLTHSIAHGSVLLAAELRQAQRKESLPLHPAASQLFPRAKVVAALSSRERGREQPQGLKENGRLQFSRKEDHHASQRFVFTLVYSEFFLL